MSAAGLFVHARSTGRYLFVQHAQTGAWESTGGRIEHGESAMEAAIREFWEETGYQGRMSIAETNYQIGDFLLFPATVAREFEPVLSSEHRAYVWAHLDQAPRPLHPGLELVVERDLHAV